MNIETADDKLKEIINDLLTGSNQLIKGINLNRLKPMDELKTTIAEMLTNTAKNLSEVRKLLK
jgi:hypothetical protein